jgi:hypothetical protein
LPKARLLVVETGDIKSPGRPGGQPAAVESRAMDSYNAAANAPDELNSDRARLQWSDF